MQLRLLALFTVALLLAACAGPPISPEERAVLERPARTLESRGEWREAAQAWQQSAQTLKGDVALELQLNAAEALLQAGDGEGATQIARSLPESMAAPLSMRRALVLADASIQAGNPLQALQRLGAGVNSPDPDLQARYRRVRADALELTGDPMAAARELSMRDPLLRDVEERYRNRQQIWDLLAGLPLPQLEVPAAQPPSAYDGWVELAAIARRHALDSAVLESAIVQWSARFPGHPAGEQIVPEVIELARTDAQAPGKVALLLPQTGPFANIAGAIRDGFMAAWYADAPNAQRPEIVLVDTHGRDVAQAYASAVDDGAQFVVGPLEKESVTAIINGAAVEVTTLALNYPLAGSQADVSAADGTQAGSALPTVSTSVSVPANATGDAPQAAPGNDAPAAASRASELQRVYYFVLSPEDEAHRAAEYAYGRGARQAAVFSAAGEWGDRVGGAFAQRWRDLGGVVVTQTSFTEDAQGLSASVEDLLNIGRSEARAKKLRSVLVRNFVQEPQPRSDADVIFLAAFPQAARQIKPQLLFHRAEGIPVLTTAYVFSGTADPQADQDLDGIIFADMPWLLSPDAHSLPAQASTLWPASSGALGRLYAFGADAYALISRLRELRVNGQGSFPGLTGNLSLDEAQHIRIDKQWATFEHGLAQPVPVSSASSSWSIANR